MYSAFLFSVPGAGTCFSFRLFPAAHVLCTFKAFEHLRGEENAELEEDVRMQSNK